MNGRRVTLQDVADAAGMSPSTVSRVLNHSSLVDAAKARRVERIADELGYEKRRRKRQSSRSILTVALVLPVSQRAHLDLFYDAGTLVSSIHASFGNTRVNVVVVPEPNWKTLFHQKKIGDIDGCILGFVDLCDEFALELDRGKIPYILVNRIPERGNFVSCDNRGGMEDLVRHVVSIRGSRTPLTYVHFEPVQSVGRQRLDGVLSGARNAGLGPDKIRIEAIHDLRRLNDRFFRGLEESGSRAVMCFNDVVAVYVYQAALRRGLRIPEDISLTGFDNSPVGRLIDQQLDTVDLGTHDLAAAAADWLRTGIMENRNEPIRRILPARYLPGETV